MTDDEIKIRRLPQGQGLDWPAHATAGFACMDLREINSRKTSNDEN